ncbi:hypothetical protein GYMLUDRAFT_101803, partial [Collybiopsis luxurians FD-317 M1]
CTPGTREQILEGIIEWANTPESQVYWMVGMAGTGKSTIAKSLCTMLRKDKLLAGAFFCSRQLPTCCDHAKLIPTIAYQLAQYSHTFAKALTQELRVNPDLAYKDIKSQMKLIINPWKAAANAKGLASIAPVIIIDALDEC